MNAHNLEKSYGTRTLFKSLSFGFESGEKVGLVGPNGVGKSTLFRILEGSIPVDAGEVVKSKGLRVGFLEQSPRFEDEVTILEALTEKVPSRDEALGSAYELISQLQLDQFGEHFKVAELSGGWQKRVALARELILEPDLLLLDEPTNHLDISGILWLESFLSNQKFAVVMITHDRLFLQRVCHRILDLDPRNPNFLLDVKGSYLEFSEAKEQILSSQLRKEEALKNKLRREKEWLSRGPQGRQTKQKARMKEAQNLDGEVHDLKHRNRNLTSGIDFGEAGHLPKKLILAKNLSKSFGTQVIFKDLDLLIRPSSRIGLLGENGCGKSTLIRCLLKMENPEKGEIEQAENLKVSYFEQNKETLDLSKTVLENICPEGDFVSFQGQFVHVRSYLERFLFFGHHAGLKVSKLSGGEMARLRIAQLMLREAHVLVLDEPTNDLDTETLDVLEEALLSFRGAVILVSHDRYFMDSVCDQLLAFPKMRNDGELLTFADYFQWENWFRSEALPKNEKVNPEPSGKSTGRSARRMSYKDKYEFETMEKTIAALEEALGEAEKKSEYGKMAQLQEEIELKFKRWAELEEIAKSSS